MFFLGQGTSCEVRGMLPVCAPDLVFSSKQRKKITTKLLVRGLNLPLKHAGVRNKRGGVSARERGSEAASQSRPPPTRLSAAQGASCFVGWPSFASFLGHTRKEGPAGRPHLNQRAEGTKKVFVTLLRAHGVKPAKFKGFNHPAMIQYLQCAAE
ncbi:hypothetical protein CSQ88_21720 [Iodobacter sp. BJB302]|nr:hypothetical protein CSQ88_21720 [Iodobacter sp. BJB302]